jgi:hypothetical protein
MSIEFGKLQIEKYAYTLFMKQWKEGKFNGQRLGQAFYNHFNMHKICDQTRLRSLYQKDGDEATALIKQLFKFS